MTITLSALFAEMSRVARTMPMHLTVALAALVGSGMAIDVLATDYEVIRFSTIASSLLQLVLQLVVMRVALARAGVARDSRNGICSLFLINIPLNLGVGIGLVLLILPGLYLSARWRLAVPRLLSEDISINQAMSSSWADTAPHWRPLMLTTALIGSGYAIGISLVLGFGDDSGMLSPPVAAVSNIALYGAFVAGWLLDVAAFRLVAPERSELAETFA